MKFREFEGGVVRAIFPAPFIFFPAAVPNPNDQFGSSIDV